MRSATFESSLLFDHGRPSPSVLADGFASETESDDGSDDWNKLPSDGGPGLYESQWKHEKWDQEKRLEYAIKYDMENGGKAGAIEDVDGAEDKGKFEVPDEVEDPEEAEEAEEAKVRAELENDIEGVKLEPEEVKAEPGNVVESVKVGPEEAELPPFRGKRAQSHNSEADSQSEPKLKKKKYSKVEIRLPKGASSIKIILKLGGGKA